jgi:hypothetical protein
MKNRIVIMVILIMLTLFPYSVLAWNNADAHMEINSLAFESFTLDKMTKDPTFLNACLCGSDTLGSAWDKSDGTQQLIQKYSPGQNIKQKPMKQWIVQGGFSADEPEGPMALRHFYDPTKNSGESWLTDSQFLTNFLSRFSSTIHNPKIDAKTWALDFGDRGDEGATTAERLSLSQDYSWYDAKKYFIMALASDSDYNMYYGMSWRGVGETMHMVSDMTVPAHVRNDGHAALGAYGPFGLIGPKTLILGTRLAFFDPDPIEFFTDDADVIKYSKGSPSSGILYDKPIDTLMDSLAIWTNRNFVSKDTIPIPGQSKMANGDPVYRSPKLTGGKVDNGYIWHDVDGSPTRMVRMKNIYTLGIWKTDEYTHEIDDAVKYSQNAILVPTAIKASTTVLDRFLPRFEATMKVTQKTSGSPTYTMSGSLKFNDKYNEWGPMLQEKLGSTKFKVNNGAYVIVNGQRTKISKRANGDYTEFTTDFSAEPGDIVSLEYDFGGYIIEATPYTIPGSKTVKQGPGCTCDDGSTIIPQIQPMGSGDDSWWYACYDKCFGKCGCDKDDYGCQLDCYRKAN